VYIPNRPDLQTHPYGTLQYTPCAAMLYIFLYAIKIQKIVTLSMESLLSSSSVPCLARMLSVYNEKGCGTTERLGSQPDP
jgi:hypothetical protein